MLSTSGHNYETTKLLSLVLVLICSVYNAVEASSISFFHKCPLFGIKQRDLSETGRVSLTKVRLRYTRV